MEVVRFSASERESATTEKIAFVSSITSESFIICRDTIVTKLNENTNAMEAAILKHKLLLIDKRISQFNNSFTHRRRENFEEDDELFELVNGLIYILFY